MADPRVVRPNNLPIHLTSFIGREREIARAKELLSSARLLTLIGAGGVGKSRVALQLAEQVILDFSDGVWVVELASTADRAQVHQAVASVLSVSEHSARPLMETLISALRPKSLLLVLDNCEHVQSGAARLVEALLHACPHLRVLTTSRVALGVPGEAMWRVPSLSLPDQQQAPTVAHLQQSEAVRLFLDRTRAVQPTFALSASNAPAVMRICQRLDGIPLAIELAAARTRVLSVEEIAAKLDDRFRLLRGGSFSGLPRHQTLQATMDWSFRLLAHKERVLLRRLSVSLGGWTLAAVEAICAGDGLSERGILDVLTSLVDKSLVIAQTQEGETRYRLLETVRQYALEQLRRDEQQAIAHRHLGFFLDLAEKTEPQLESAEQAAWLKRLGAEHGNLEEALSWSLRSAPEKGLRLAAALARFWMVCGHLMDGRRWLAEALTRDSGGSPALRAKALNWAGWIAVRQCDYQAARAFHEESLTLSRNLADKRGVADSLRHLGNLAVNESDHASVRSFYEESLAIHRDLGDKIGVLKVLSGLGHEAWLQGDHASARSFLEEGLALARGLGHAQMLVTLLWHLGLVAFDQHDYGEARTLYMEGLARAKELGEAFHRVSLVEAFAALVAQEEQHIRAARLLGAADAYRKAGGVPRSFAYRTHYDRHITNIRDRLNREAFAAAWVEGQAMTLDEAIEDALTAGERQRHAVEPAGAGGVVDSDPDILTPREWEVATLVAQGLTNREIASRVNISERTAETHVRNILSKLNVSSRTQLAIWALAHVTPPFPLGPHPTSAISSKIDKTKTQTEKQR